MNRLSTFCVPLMFCVPSILLMSVFSLPASAQVTPSDDSYTLSSTPATNYGTKNTLLVESAGATTFLRFDLTSIPPSVTGSMVAKATLKIYVATVPTAGSFNVVLVTSAWTESTITANNSPTLGSAIASAVPVTTADKNQYVLVDVTAAVVDWLSGTANDGIALVPDGTVSFTLNSKETTTTSHPAELDIVLSGPPGPITGVTAGAGLTGGGTKGNVTLSMLTSCTSGQVLQWNGSTWACAATGTGTITGVTAGTDLTGGGKSGNVTLNLDTTKVPQLGASNSFTGNETISGNVTAGGTVSGNLGSFTGNSSSTILNVIQNATSGSGSAVAGTSYNANPHQAALLGQELASGADVFGVEGFVFGPAGAGVYGQNNNPQSSVGAASTGGAGVWGDSGSKGATGVLATASNVNGLIALNNSGASAAILAENQNTTSGSSSLAPAVVGYSFAPQGIGVLGSGPVHSKNFSSGAGGNAIGVVGDSAAATGIGVWGSTDSGTSVYGSTGTGTGVFGLSGTGTGVIGSSNGTDTAGVYGVTGNTNATVEGYGVSGHSTSTTTFNTGVLGDSAYGAGVVGITEAAIGYAGFFEAPIGAVPFFASGAHGNCTVDGSGDLICTGSKSAAVPLPDNRWVRLYAVESPENWFEDFGSGQLSDGSAVITLEPTFAQTVNTGADYRVFPVPNGDCKGLYVAEKTATGFVVRELGGGKSNVAFDYRIVARRKGYENIRMADVTEMHNRDAAMAERMAKRLPRRPPVIPGDKPDRPGSQIQMPIPQRPGVAYSNDRPVLPGVKSAPAQPKR